MGNVSELDSWNVCGVIIVHDIAVRSEKSVMIDIYIWS